MRRVTQGLGGVATALLLAGTVQAQTADTLAAQRAAYDAVRAKTILDLQPFRTTVTAVDEATGLEITLIDLSPKVGAWFLLQTRAGAKQAPVSYHLENPAPGTRQVTLDLNGPALLVDGIRCRPWADEALVKARQTGLGYAPICDGKLYLRNKISGAYTTLEATAEFLRDNVWGGENIVRFVRDNFFKDSQLETGDAVGQIATGPAAGPAPMLTNFESGERPVIATLLDMAIKGGDPRRMAVGAWYPVTGVPGVFASTFQPRYVADAVMQGPGTANRLDGIEARATGYMIGFDMGQFDIGYAVGTDHPSLGWSPRPSWNARPKGLPGPDGVSRPDPLVMLGMVNPEIANKAVATFTAGFKRQHGAFKYGDMAGFNYGHHYGFVEKGVVLSKLWPGLSTLFELTDGSVHMNTWTAADDALLPQIRFARQNGVPILETDPETGMGIPGDRVTKWGPGNWSGSAKAELRTLRAGACMARAQGTRYLIYGYFSTATPSAMARTFQAYGCDYAMLLDMNALEHTYLAVYARQGGQVHVEHLVPGMALIEKKMRDGTILPRFIGFADNRDLFYLTRKEP
ncbi:hypothetical protein [Antarcticimicrobium sediminis]|uniref:Uncharacterized protein n=1 Tax=Antarcticimicrobium sediminis TaxID=2546227 RepID=A0A4R5ETU4_9RHOB|nr:hypothetical protein [Antarcticimicrobium sediminis]TDE38311.1 hypothetical protein E1B25_09295 [Antarcticimicrobium sediminis]